MSQNVVAERLVNATNIVFHLMELQPFALILPMEPKDAARNKHKIMKKIVCNNRSLPSKKASDMLNPTDGKEGAASGNYTNAGSKHTGETSSTGKGPLEGKDGSQDGTYKSTQDGDATSLNGTTVYESQSSESNATGDYSQSNATNKNFSPDELTISESDYDLPVDDVNSPFYTVHHVIERLDSDDMNGCIIMLAAKSENDFGVVPLAGGVIEIYDEHERSIQAMWVNRSLEQRSDLKVLLKTLVLRIFAHAYQICLPDKRSTKSNKLVSIYQSLLVTFPKECVPFIEKEMLLSKHYETAGFNEPHNDNPKVPCRCHKLAAQATELFYGISESRFNNLYSKVYEKMLFESIGMMNPIAQMYPATSFTHSEKMDQITKAVREIERSLKEQNANKRPKR